MDKIKYNEFIFYNNILRIYKCSVKSYIICGNYGIKLLMTFVLDGKKKLIVCFKVELR